MDKPVVLTAEMAHELCRTKLLVLAPQERAALESVQDKRTVCVPRISEAEARTEYERMWGPESGSFRSNHWSGYLSALRHYGILLPTGEKGT